MKSSNTFVMHVRLSKILSFPLRISSVNLTKSSGSCGFGHINYKNTYWKT